MKAIARLDGLAERHYLTLTDEHWSKAVNSRAPAGAPIANGAGTITTNQMTKKPLRNMGYDASQGLMMAAKIPPTGIEPVTPALGKLCSIQLSYEGAFERVISWRLIQYPSP